MQSFVGLCLLLGVGHLLRTHVRFLQRLYLPSSVLGGLIGLLVLQLADLGSAPVPPEWTAGWSRLPGMLINIVFACLFLGSQVPNVRTLWRRAGPQLAYGQVVAWGQYVVGIGLTLVLLVPLFGVPEMFGAIVPVGFEGGHGTASGLAKTFDRMGWEQGKDFANASATAGIMSAIIVGMVLVNWAIRRGHTQVRKKPVSLDMMDLSGVIPREKRPAAGRLPMSADAIESLTLQAVFIGVAVGIGWLLKQGLVVLAGAIGNESFIVIAGGFPLFPLCMVGGLLVQIFEQKYDPHDLVDHGLMRRIQGISLDFLVVAAIATINVRALIPALAPFAILVTAGILWNVFCVTWLARRLLPDTFFERSIAEMGQSMGVTATGLVLLRVVDPDYETPAADAFASKQLLHEPFMGGGLWTSAAVPLIAQSGGLLVFGIACGVSIAWVALVVLVWRPRWKQAT
ncbi:MAG: sodium/glutamate symporter [Phycisphaerae bacterium]